jgi:hypothetical protein
MSSVGVKLASIIRVTGISETVIGWHCCRPGTGEPEGDNMSKGWKELESQKEENIFTN